MNGSATVERRLSPDARKNNAIRFSPVRKNYMQEININGVIYVPKDEKITTEVTDKQYVIVRTYSAGVFAGYLTERSEDGKRGKVLQARRLWYWSGASSLSQLSQEGVKNPGECKFPCVVPFVELNEIIEVLPCTDCAKASIDSVPVWQS